MRITRQVIASIMFTGQGSQFVGMSHKLLKTPSLMNHPYSVHLRSNYHRLFELMEKHPTLATVEEEEELTQTAVAQPAILSHSILTWELFKNLWGLRRKEAPLYSTMKIPTLAGHSLGEYTALTVGGVISFENALKLVEARGITMQKYPEVLKNSKLHHQQKERNFGMMALIPCDENKARDLVKAFHKQTQNKWFLEITNINSDKQVVLAGSQEAFHYLKSFFSLRKKWGILLSPSLKVSVPFHSSLLKPISKSFETILDNYIPAKGDLSSEFKLFSNVSTNVVSSKTELNTLLKQQVYTPINWYGCMKNICIRLAEEKEKIQKETDKEVRTYVLEIGPKNVLADLMSNMGFDGIERPFNVLHLEDESSVQQFFDSLPY